MRIIDKEELQRGNTILSCEIIKFNQSDFISLKKFVLQETAKIKDDFFITDDIDTAFIFSFER